MQPPERRSVAAAPALALPDVLARARAVPAMGVTTWDDIERIDVRPDKGLVKVVSKTRWEVQLDAATGAVLQSAYRRSDLIESLHDGSWFHEGAKLGVFLPTALVVLGLWATGAYLFLLPIRTRRENHRKAAERAARRAAARATAAAS